MTCVVVQHVKLLARVCSCVGLGSMLGETNVNGVCTQRRENQLKLQYVVYNSQRKQKLL